MGRIPNINKAMKQAMKSTNPSEMIESIMGSADVQQTKQMGKKIEDALNIVLEGQQILNDNVLTYKDFFVEIDQRLKSIEEKLNIRKL